MNIPTKFGIAENVKIEEYGMKNSEVYTLGYIENDKNGEYKLLGFDAPLDNDSVWRFWIEFGYKDGSSETKLAELNKTDEDLIKDLYAKYKSN